MSGTLSAPRFSLRRGGALSTTLVLVGLLVFAILYSMTIGRYGLRVYDVGAILIDNVVPQQGG